MGTDGRASITAIPRRLAPIPIRSVCNDHGLDFELDDDPLLMVEGVHRYNKDRLAGAIKIGGWNHFGTFEDQRFDSGGALIAVTGNPGAPLDNDWGIYGIIDQLLWRVPGSEDPKGVGDVRPRRRRAGGPQSDRLLLPMAA